MFPNRKWIGQKKHQMKTKRTKKKPKIIMENIEKLETRNVETERIEKEP